MCHSLNPDLPVSHSWKKRWQLSMVVHQRASFVMEISQFNSRNFSWYSSNEIRKTQNEQQVVKIWIVCCYEFINANLLIFLVFLPFAFWCRNCWGQLNHHLKANLWVQVLVILLQLYPQVKKCTVEENSLLFFKIIVSVHLFPWIFGWEFTFVSSGLLCRIHDV